MRLAALLLLLMLAAACSPAKPAPQVAPANEIDAAPPAAVTTTEDASAPAAQSNANEPCSPTPCRMGERAIDITADGNDVVFLKTFGLGGRHQLARRAPADREETVLAMDVRPTRTARVRRVVVDKDVYFLATSEGVATWEKSNVVTLIGPNPSGAEQIAVDDASVFFMSVDCTLRRVAKTGGAVEELAKGNPQATYCGVPHLALDDGNVYFTADDVVFAIAKSPKARARPIKRVLMPKNEQRGVLGITVDADNVYALLAAPPTGGPKGKIVRISKKGGAVTEVAKLDPVGQPYSLGSDATRLYWLEQGQGKVALVSMTKPNGERKVIAEAPGIGYGMAVGPASNVFFVAWEMGGPGSAPRVWRVTK